MYSAQPDPDGSGGEPLEPIPGLLGGPPPWAGLPPERRRPIRLGSVVGSLRALGQSGPGPAGRPAPDDPLAQWRHLLPAGGSSAHASAAAVLVALFEEGGEARVVLTRRSTELRTHRGQVSLPGGRIDVGEDAAGAALREAREEIGLDPGLVRIVGWLHPLFTFSGSSLVLPVVGVLDGRPSVLANPDEVARVFDVELAELVGDGVYREETWDPNEAWSTTERQARRIWFFDVDHERVWGATARILHELVLVSLGVQFQD